MSKEFNIQLKECRTLEEMFCKVIDYYDCTKPLPPITKGVLVANMGKLVKLCNLQQNGNDEKKKFISQIMG